MRFLPPRFLRRRRSLIATAVLVLAVPSAWLLAGNTAPDDAAVVARVKRGAFAVTVTTSGELKAREFVQITAPPNAQQAGAYQMKISSIVPEGTVVKKGDVVAELDRSVVAAKLQDVTLALQKAEAQYEQAMLDSTLNLSTARRPRATTRRRPNKPAPRCARSGPRSRGNGACSRWCRT